MGFSGFARRTLSVDLRFLRLCDCLGEGLAIAIKNDGVLTPPDEIPARLSGGAADLAAGLVAGGVAVLFIGHALRFEEADHTGIGPATFPMGIAILLAISAAMLAGRGVLTLCGRAENLEVAIGRPWWVALGIALVTAFPALMIAAGYYIATAMWLPAFLFVAGYRNPLGIGLVTLGFLAFAKVAFEVVLGVRLP